MITKEIKKHFLIITFAFFAIMSIGINYCFANDSDGGENVAPEQCDNCGSRVFIYEYDPEFRLATYTCVVCGRWYVVYDDYSIRPINII